MGAGATTGTAGVAAMNGAQSFGWVGNSNGLPSVRWVLRQWCPSRYSPIALPPSAPPPSLIGARGLLPGRTAAPLPVPSPEWASARDGARSRLLPPSAGRTGRPAKNVIQPESRGQGSRRNGGSPPTTANPKASLGEAYPCRCGETIGNVVARRDRPARRRSRVTRCGLTSPPPSVRSSATMRSSPSGALVDEAAVLRVKALISAGRRDEARRFAQRGATRPPARPVSHYGIAARTLTLG